MHSQVTYRCDDGFPYLACRLHRTAQLQQPRPGLLLIYEAFGISTEMDRVAADLAHEGGWTVPILDLPASDAAEVDQPTCAGCIGVVRIVVRNEPQLCLRRTMVRRMVNRSRW